MTHERYSFQNLNIHCVSLPHTHPARDSRVNAKFQVHIGDASIPSDSHRVHCGVVFSFRKEGNTRPNFLDWKFRRKRLFLSWKQTLRCRFPISSEIEFISVSRNSRTQLLKVENHRGCIGVIGAQVFVSLPARLSRIYFTLSSQPGSTLRHRYVVDCLEVADSVHVRTCPTKRQLTWTIYATSLLNPNTEPDLSLVCEAESVTQRRANNRKF